VLAVIGVDSLHDFSNPVSDNITLRAHWKLQPVDSASTDSNGNGVPDNLDEIMGYGTDHDDTDSDGVPDFYEENVYGTDKYREDTDGDAYLMDMKCSLWELQLSVLIQMVMGYQMEKRTLTTMV